MIASCDSKGDDVPKSTRKPVFLDTLFQFTVVPGFTQKGTFDLLSAMLGVTEVESAVRFMSTSQDMEADPHVFAAVHTL